MVIARSRNWTDAEVMEAVAAIRSEPGLWDALEEEERKPDGDFTDTDIGKAEWRILSRLHPDLQLHEKNQLYYAIRKYRRVKLGL